MRFLIGLTLALLSFNANPAWAQSGPSIVLCESYDDYGKASGINTSWVIEKSGGFIYVLFNNNAVIKGSLWLYVDKQNSKGTYDPSGTKTFEVKSGSKWAVFDYNFTEAGKYKISAVSSSGTELAVSYATISFKSSSTTTANTNTTNTSSDYSSGDKSITLCEKYDTYGKASGIYKTWTIKETGGYVNVVYNNGGKNITGALWLYVDKKNSEGDYVAYDTQTFETGSGKTWSAYQYTFKEAGEYKISAVSSKGEEAMAYTTIEFASGVQTKTERSLVLCDSYDDYGKPMGIATVWNIKKEGGWIYILYNHGEKIKQSISLYVDKKNTTGKYEAYETKTFTYDGTKNWSVFDFNFKEAGDYLVSAVYNGSTLASVNATVKYTDATTTTTTSSTTTKTEDKPDTWYYDKSNIYFAATADAAGNMTGEATTFTVPVAGKELKVVYKDDKACKTKKIVVDVYTGDNYDEFVETKEFVTTPAQKVITFSYFFKNEGKYKLSVYNDNDVFMNLGMLTIKKASTTTTTTTPSTKPNTVTNTTTTTTPNTISTTSFNTEGPRTALVIGNGNYVSAGTLPNPVHDAEEMAKALKACGFDVTLVLNGNRKQMNEAINTFGQKIIAKKGTGMVFYAGHGVQSKGENYLIPVDASLSVEEDLQYECVNVGQVLSKMEAAGNPINIVALDACRNNPFERSWHRSANGNGLVGINAPEGTIIAFSTNPGNVASDGSGYNSPYTTAFLSQLKKPGLTIEQVLKGVAADVKKTTPGQLPWYSSSITGEFYFRP